ncbi:hypothetical protein ENUP19_0085G0145 [Entamoeba nuttalli]|uniref:Leucine-rich repeat containing protein n=2 Tax=Entamoeba nuttalli TaxID=412467 RepID=K2HD73_ENTNP|nr:leucine-rich repeat containing protein [Entamoeba nuttalli P19]EKE40669.1 leucine-rich repeat containing protein [Entamoeba nuttalli P19]|eukprot:XP_008856993.1 leucine-rich repeat containing protein [Entamoeba nuttalli P19]
MFWIFLLYIISCFGAQNNEKEVLINFYNQLNGPNWKISTNWLSNEKDICEWYGIECDKDGYVFQISLDSNNLEGKLPSLSSLTHLYAFVADNNKLTGSLSAFNGLKGFMALNIKNNLFSGPIYMIGTTMKWLHADNNKFTDIFSLVKHCPEIEVIGLTHNKVKTIPRSIGTLHHLRTLSLGQNDITSEIPNDLNGLINVATIDLSNNKISGSIPITLGQLPVITEILLQNNNLSGSIPNTLFNASSLTLIDLSNNSLSGSLNDVLNSKTLVTAYLQYTDIEGPIPPLYSSSLRHLDLRGTKVDCPILDANREIIVADCPPRVIVEADVMSKCPDFRNFGYKIAAPLLEKIGSIIDFKIGWIMTPSSSYSTGYSSMHGNTEVIGDFLFTCALEIYNASKAFDFYNCMGESVDLIPLNYTSCAQQANMDPESLIKCAFGSYGNTLMKEAVDRPIQMGSTWCPTVYINNERYCLYDSYPCNATTLDDYIRDICAAYTGTNKPSACPKEH